MKIDFSVFANFDAFRLHASAVVINNNAYLLSGSSDIGESTLSSMWLEIFGSGAYLINDDKPVAAGLILNGMCTVPPWNGKRIVNASTTSRLGAYASL